jgi:DnaK suppressor protein
MLRSSLIVAISATRELVLKQRTIGKKSLMNKRATKKRQEAIARTSKSLIGIRDTLISKIGTEGRTDLAEVRDAGMDSGDLAAEVNERDLRILLSRRGRSRIVEIGDALQRIGQADYGRCESCGLEITEQRLKAVPFTRHCCDCQGDRERQAKTSNPGDSVAYVRDMRAEDEVDL